MSDIAIQVEHLGKMYRVGAPRERYRTLRDSLVGSIWRPFHRLRSRGSGEPKDSSFWALDDVSIDVNRGEVLGIIGRNGAGKSTLLKILSRITEPTRGRVTVRGRVGSLLEVGTGFHPELTGRENIYLNGAILGMKRAEIQRKFDEIVAFAEIEKFLDTPVKRYSSGMYVRLAFAVAAHLEPEILVVDEVLAVGDAEFQKKCLGKMEEVAHEGRTVVFVSHNMNAVRSLCERAVLLEKGKVLDGGKASLIVNRYLGGNADTLVPCRPLDNAPRVRGNGLVRVVKAELSDVNGQPSTSFGIGDPFFLSLDLKCMDTQLPPVSLWFLVRSQDGNVVLSSFEYDGKPWLAQRPDKIDFSATVRVEPNGLIPGTYELATGVFGWNREFYDWVDSAIKFEIKPMFVNGRPFDDRLGFFTLPCEWERR